MAWSVPSGVLSDRYPPRYVIIAGWTLYALVYAGFAAASTVWQVGTLFVMYGQYYGLTEAPDKTLVAAPDALRARAFGTYHFAISLGALPASLLFGVLWEAVGPGAAFLTGAALAAAALLPLALQGIKPLDPEHAIR